MKTSYGYSKNVNGPFEQVKEKIKLELQNEGFGILTEIDVKAVLKKKLDVDFTDYVILGACNPPNAYKALQTETEVGLLLPCNVIIYHKDGENFVSAILPSIAMKITNNEALEKIALDIEAKLEKAINNL